MSTTATNAVDALPRSQARCLFVSLKLLHLLCAVNFASQTFVFSKLGPADSATVRAFNPRVMAICFAILAFLHLLLLVGPRGRSCLPTWRCLSSMLIPTAGRHPWREWLGRHRDAGLLVMNSVELACQTYQLVLVLSSAIDRWFAVSYGVVVVSHCLVTPIIVYLINSSLHTIAVTATRTAFSFGLSCFLPFVCLGMPSLGFILGDTVAISTHGTVLYTRLILMGRIFVPSSTLDFTAKIVMDIGTLVSLYRLASILARRSPCRTVVVAPMVVSSVRKLPRRRPSRIVSTCLLASVVAGVILTGLLVRAWVFRTRCPPSTCLAFATPLLDLSCHCKYAYVNCYLLGNESLDVNAELDARRIGATLFVLHVARCNLVAGLDSTMLASQRQLETIHIEFTKMMQWDGVLPPSMQNVLVRYSALDHLPAILSSPMPPTMETLHIEGSPLGDLPQAIGSTWQSLSQVILINVSFVRVPDAVTRLCHVGYVNLRFNSLGAMNMHAWALHASAMAELTELHLTGCGLTDGPWALSTPDCTLDLRANPIAAVPSTVDSSLLETHKLLLDDTSFCNTTHAPFCQPSGVLCAPSCLRDMIGNGLCDLACLNAACGFDDLDCTDVGLTAS
ncbi:Aste57867_12343 [Aphanomyces stellatus]|uniref:Aste57867_12343 protein n=1 Tax=Aphanomyces stellatus TaxID=120398 RepID=A0A485KVS6_9STRA|nr:hypothetical protein As57867_012297 [Aphanomyces stellatus]VFT89195.1 Aste57867_12343 [Aphanomyces stellatus]